jgi:hypothetical protein
VTASTNVLAVRSRSSYGVAPPAVVVVGRVVEVLPYADKRVAAILGT